MTGIQAVSLILVALGGTAVALTRDPRRQVFVSGFYGLLLTVLLFALQSPDVALSELVIGTVALPVILLLTLTKVRSKPK